MRAVMLTTRQPNQVALTHKLGSACNVAGVVASRNMPRRPVSKPLRAHMNRIAGRTAGAPLTKAWHDMQARYEERWPQLPHDVPTVEVSDVNDADAIKFVQDIGADLAVVSGTSLVAPETIDALAPSIRFVNLHTGISPYVKGAPNCTNWCLARGWFHLIGNTVMWLDTGIDSGDLIATERTPLNGRETLLELHWAVMEHAHDLCVRCVSRLAEGRPVPRIPQGTVATGNTFYAAQWTAIEMIRARWNFARGFPAAVGSRGQPPPLRLVGVDEAA